MTVSKHCLLASFSRLVVLGDIPSSYPLANHSVTENTFPEDGELSKCCKKHLGTLTSPDKVLCGPLVHIHMTAHIHLTCYVYDRNQDNDGFDNDHLYSRATPAQCSHSGFV
mmetsp:Transcript_10607/g.17320  ORF Transcript_10607/g.17320 Transcript_10607/m.17320 type:complete len:111 (-) Transcript_10607:1061-1393(-)